MAIWGTNNMPNFYVSTKVHRYVGGGSGIPDCITSSDFQIETEPAQWWMSNAAKHAYNKLNQISSVFNFVNPFTLSARNYWDEEFPDHCGNGNSVNERVLVVYFFTNIKIADAWFGGTDSEGNLLAEYVRLGVVKNSSGDYHFQDWKNSWSDSQTTKRKKILPSMMHECEHAIGSPADHSWPKPSINSFFYKDNNGVDKFIGTDPPPQNYPWTGWAQTSIGVDRNYYTNDQTKVQSLYGG